ncbi:MAG: phosphatase PAP2 family protein [Panacagrimonas sp.]
MDRAVIFIAEHLLGVFAALVLCALGLAVLLWWLVRRLREPLWRRSVALLEWVSEHPRSRDLAQRLSLVRRLHTSASLAGRYLLFDLTAGFFLALAALSVFFELADETGLDEELGRFDVQLAQQLGQTVSTATLQFFATVTHLADAPVQWFIALAVAVLLLATRRRWMAASWMAAVAGNGLLNRSLKAIFQRERPLHDHGWVVESGWSFPSGHASGAVAIYGMLAYLLIRSTRPAWHLPIALSAIVVILLVGFSRIVLQVHYFSDVIAGFASAGAWLIVCVATAEVVRVRRPPRS